VTAITFFVDSDRQLDQSNDEKNAEHEQAAITAYSEVAAS
jgi:hypothetical protein